MPVVAWKIPINQNLLPNSNTQQYNNSHYLIFFYSSWLNWFFFFFFSFFLSFGMRVNFEQWSPTLLLSVNFPLNFSFIFAIFVSFLSFFFFVFFVMFRYQYFLFTLSFFFLFLMFVGVIRKRHSKKCIFLTNIGRKQRHRRYLSYTRSYNSQQLV